VALLQRLGCDHQTNTVFVDVAANHSNGSTVRGCARRYTGRVLNQIKRGCAYDAADDFIRTRVDRAIRHGGAASASVTPRGLEDGAP
jgi:hypothetical protein